MHFSHCKLSTRHIATVVVLGNFTLEIITCAGHVPTSTSVENASGGSVRMKNPGAVTATILSKSLTMRVEHHLTVCLDEIGVNG